MAWVFLKQLSAKIILIRRHLVRSKSQFLCVRLLDVVERKFHGQHAPQDDAYGETVHLVCIRTGHNFWSPVLHGAQHVLEKNTILKVARRA